MKEGRMSIFRAARWYRRARRRAIFLDWGGTLVSLESSFTASLVEYYREALPGPVHHCLEELAQGQVAALDAEDERPQVARVRPRRQQG